MIIITPSIISHITPNHRTPRFTNHTAIIALRPHTTRALYRLQIFIYLFLFFCLEPFSVQNFEFGRSRLIHRFPTRSRSLPFVGMASAASVASAPLNKIERAHQLYREGRYSEALGFYTEALSTAKAKSQKIALHSNRAACFLKLHDFKKVPFQQLIYLFFWINFFFCGIKLS